MKPLLNQQILFMVYWCLRNIFQFTIIRKFHKVWHLSTGVWALTEMQKGQEAAAPAKFSGCKSFMRLLTKKIFETH